MFAEAWLKTKDKRVVRQNAEAKIDTGVICHPPLDWTGSTARRDSCVLTVGVGCGTVITEEVTLLGGAVPGPSSARPRDRLVGSSFFITNFPPSANSTFTARGFPLSANWITTPTFTTVPLIFAGAAYVSVVSPVFS